MGCGEAKEGFDQGFDTKFHEGFVKSCVEFGGPARRAAVAATTMCNCTSDKIKEKLSAKEKMTLKNEQILPLVEECRAANPA